MNLLGNADSAKLKKIVALYNMIPNVFWSLLNLIPISYFCYNVMNVKLFYIFLITATLTLLLPRSFFDSIQLGTTRSVYKKIGVNFINKFTQNGAMINRLIKRKFPAYKVLSNRNLSINRLLKQTYIFEKFHFAMFVFFILTAIYALEQNCFMWAFLISVTNLVYNVYPNFLQQYIRIRLIASGKKTHMTDVPRFV